MLKIKLLRGIKIVLVKLSSLRDKIVASVEKSLDDAQLANDKEYAIASKEYDILLGVIDEEYKLSVRITEGIHAQMLKDKLCKLRILHREGIYKARRPMSESNLRLADITELKVQLSIINNK